MGFIKEKYLNNRGGLSVAYQGDISNDFYFAGDSVQEALDYFNMYIEDNQIFYHTEEELALAEAGISTLTEAEQLRQELNEMTSTMTDEEAVERAILFPLWKVGINYTVNTRIRYGGRIFTVLQNHTSQKEWTPSRAPSLFAEILTSVSGEPLPWQQPSSTNPYLTGDKVIYEGQVYESLIDNNVWSPADYPNGWKLISQDQEEEVADWQQPNATNPYMIGDKVRFNGQIYESTINNNIWSPTDYPAGWTLIA